MMSALARQAQTKKLKIFAASRLARGKKITGPKDRSQSEIQEKQPS